MTRIQVDADGIDEIDVAVVDGLARVASASGEEGLLRRPQVEQGTNNVDLETSTAQWIGTLVATRLSRVNAECMTTITVGTWKRAITREGSIVLNHMLCLGRFERQVLVVGDDSQERDVHEVGSGSR